jgi:predicted RNA-binding protein with PUA-like domain
MSRINHWILKTEPEEYSYADLEREKTTVWSGVSNNTALIHIRSMQVGDQALIYHTGKERQVVGIAEICSEPYADPQQDNEKLVVVKVKPVRLLAKPVHLATIKADPVFSDSPLVRQGRLSVVPLSDSQWQHLLSLAETQES